VYLPRKIGKNIKEGDNYNGTRGAFSMNILLNYPWGFVMLLIFSFFIWGGKMRGYLRSLRFSGFWFSICVLAVFSAFYFSIAAGTENGRLYFSPGALGALLLPSLYWLAQKPALNRVRILAVAALIAFLNIYVNMRAYSFYYFPPGFYIVLCGLVAAAAGKRSNAYAALFSGIIAAQLYLGLRGFYGFSEIIGTETLNYILMAVIPLELTLWIINVWRGRRKRDPVNI
jgi:hypothetical protein